LAEQLKELSVLNLDFDLEATGFTMGEIDLCIDGPAAREWRKESDAPASRPLTGVPRTGLW
jgi:hypothetical protein